MNKKAKNTNLILKFKGKLEFVCNVAKNKKIANCKS